jgi:gliding-associated putative ABC transporter substrate-binding component GldG
MRNKARSIRNLLLVIIAVVLLNLVGSRFHYRADLTSDHRFTLSPATLDMLKAMPEAATVTAYFTEELPPDLAVVRQDLKDLLVEYAERSGGNILFEFIDPNVSDSLERQAQDEGVGSVLVNTREKDKAAQLKAYMGFVVRMADRVATVPFIQPGSALEWSLSSAIHQVSLVDKPVVGLLQGHGEPAKEALPQLEQAMSALYGLEPMALYGNVPVHARFSALLWIEPTDSLPADQLAQLDAYLARGGGLVVASSRSEADLTSTAEVSSRRPDLARWLERHGVQLEPGIVVDASCGQVQMMQQRGMFQVPVPMPFPYFPLITSFVDHPVASGLEAVLFQFTSPLTFTGDTSGTTFTPVLRSSAKSAVLVLPRTIDIQKQWTDMDFLMGDQVVGAALEEHGSDGPRRRMVVFGNGSFMLNGTGPQQTQVNPANLNLVVNALDWITDSTGLIELRNKGVGFRPLEETTDEVRAMTKWTMLLLPVLLVLGHGAVRSRWRKRQRNQRMRPGHVQ